MEHIQICHVYVCNLEETMAHRSNRAHGLFSVTFEEKNHFACLKGLRKKKC